jgi:hypothetical protein
MWIAITRSTWSVAQNYLNPAKIERHHAVIKTVNTRCVIMKVMPEKAKKRLIQSVGFQFPSRALLLSTGGPSSKASPSFINYRTSRRPRSSTREGKTGRSKQPL